MHLNILLQVLQSAYLAASATVFYRKHFELKWTWTILGFIVAGYSTSLSYSFNLLSLAAAPAIIYYSWSIVRGCDLWTFLTFLVAIMDPSTYTLCPVIRTTLTFTTALCAAVPQFMRCQPFMIRFRELRARLGPVYILYVLRTALLIYDVDKAKGLMLFVSFLFAILAGVLFRPDNSVLLSLFIVGVRRNIRKCIHRSLMILSFVCMFIVAVLFGINYVHESYPIEM